MDHSLFLSPEPWRPVSLDRPSSRLLVTDAGHEVTIWPGAAPDLLAALLVQVPRRARFVEHHGDLDVTLVFRAGPVPPPSSAAARLPDDGDGPDSPGVAMPAGPIEHEPPLITLGDREPALRRALAGVALGAFDERTVAWLAGWDTPTVATLASLIHRARATERALT